MRFLLVVIVSGCGTAVPAGHPATPALEASWRIRWHGDLPVPAWMEGRTERLALTPDAAERAGRAFLLRYADRFGLAGSELDHDGAELDEHGMIHVRFTQWHAHVRVWGSELRLHFARDGTLVRVHGRSVPVGDPDSVPLRSADEARRAALLDARALRPEVEAEAFTTRTPRLWLHPADDGVRLAWRVEVDVEDGKRPMALEIFVDAGDGSIRSRDDRLRTLTGHGRGVFGDWRELSISERNGDYWLEDPERGAAPTQKTYSAAGRTHLPGTGVRSPDPEEWDVEGAGAGAAVDAHAHVARIWDYFRSEHGRAGWDGRGHGVHATVHFGSRYAGAFYDGRRLVFGDGDEHMSPPAAALDIVAHEFTHGLVLHTADLGGQGESGAVHEAVCDLFAGFISGQWQIGRTVFHPSGRPTAIRDIEHPRRTGHPQALAEWLPRGDAHRNSTVVSHAGFVMAQALGSQSAARIWYRALTRYLTSQAGLADAADATFAAAADLERGEEGAVRAAWIAAGVWSE